MSRLVRILAFVASLVLPLAGSITPSFADGCHFVLGFLALQQLIPSQVGSCVDNQAYGPNGDALQHTTGQNGAGGLLVWRKADNWTAYTDGYRTWINGPQGLQQRLNTERFPWEAPSTAPALPPPPSAVTPRFATFGDGTLIVGKDIAPGTYRNKSPHPGCYWARLKGFSGATSDIITNENANGPQVVTISGSDSGFESDGCGTWTTDLSAITPSPTSSFNDGVNVVGVDIAPGTWRSQGATACYWEREATFSGLTGDIIANDNTTGAAVVTIGGGDKGFKSDGCGRWTKIG